MAAKLTFEAQMNGLEKILEYLNKADTQLSDLGKHGGDAFSIMDRKAKDFNASMEYISKNKGGLSGIDKMFDDINNKAQSILGRTQNKILENYKSEVKKFENEVKNIDNQITSVTNRLQELESKKQTMSEKDYIREQKALTDEKNRTEQKLVIAKNAENEAKRMIYNESPFFGKFGAQAREKGGLIGSILGASNEEANARIPGLIAGMTAVIGGIPKLGGAYYGAAIYDKVTQPANEFLSQMALQQQISAAREGNITTGILGTAGLSSISDPEVMKNIRSEAYWDSIYSSRAFKGVIGAGIGAYGAYKLGIKNPYLIGIAAAGGGAMGAYTAKPVSEEQLTNEKILEVQQQQAQMHDVTVGQAGRNFREEGTLTLAQQRMFGINTSHANTAMLLQQGVADLKDLAGFIGELNKFGKTLKNAQAGVFGERFGMTGAAGRAEFARSVAAYGDDAAMQRAKDLAAKAGFYGRETMPGREVLTEYAAQLASQRGFGVTDISQTGAFAASIAGQMSNLPSSVAAQTAVTMAGAINQQMGRGGGLLNTMMGAAFARLGITDLITQEMYMQSYQTDPEGTIKKIAEEGDYTEDQVREILTGAMKNATQAMATATGLKPGTKSYRMAERIGAPDVFAFTGNLAAAENAKKGNIDLSGAAQLMGKKPIDTSNVPFYLKRNVEMGEGFEDIKSGKRALEAANVESTMEKIAQSQGKTVADIIQREVANGFASMAQQIAGSTAKLGYFNANTEKFGKQLADDAMKGLNLPVNPVTTTPGKEPPPKK